MKHFSAILAVLIALIALAGCSSAPTGTTGEPPKIGLQAYTFRQLTFEETLDRAQALGIPYLQAYPGQRLSAQGDATFHHNMDAQTQAHVLNLIKSKGLVLASYGVVTGRDEAEWRQIFTFAKAMGLQNITTEPPESSLKLVARLAQEFQIKVALHNHPTPSVYANPETAIKAARKHRGWIGLCADTGHWARSGYDPVASLRQAKGQLLELHFKDLTELGVKQAHDVPWGTGASSAAAQIAELRRQNFSGIVYVEYEHATPTLMKDVERSVGYFKQAISAPLADLVADRVPPPGYTTDITAVWSERQTGYGAPKWPMPKPLFDPALSRAEITAGKWTSDQDVLVPQGQAELWSRDSFRDFVLSLEFMCQEGSEGKIHLRAPAGEKGIAVQILQGDATDDKHLVGAVYGLMGPSRQITIKPGEWYRAVIKVHGQEVRVMLDGETVTKLNVKAPKPANPQPIDPNAPPPPPEPQPIAIPAEGRVGLQSGEKPVQFRHVRIESL